MRPAFPYLQGALLFALVAAFLWGERVHAGRAGGDVGGVRGRRRGGAVRRPGAGSPPGVDRLRSRWPAASRPATSSSSTGPSAMARSTGRGPGTRCFRSRRPPGLLEGRGPRRVQRGAAGRRRATPGRPRPTRCSRSARPRCAMDADDPGDGRRDVDLDRDRRRDRDRNAGARGHDVLAGASPGTWVTGSPLGPGDSYQITTYTPRPTATELQAARRPSTRARWRRIGRSICRARTPRAAAAGRRSPAFHSGRRSWRHRRARPRSRRRRMRAAFALATRLADEAATPYAFVTSVERYLSHGYTLRRDAAAEHLSAGELPVPGQARLLPAVRRGDGAAAADGRGSGPGGRRLHRRAATTRPTHRWVVTDLDAHAWVEAWFPRYGWVRFDPTPAAAPARGGRTPIAPAACRRPAPRTAPGAHPACPRELGGRPALGRGRPTPGRIGRRR